MQFGDIAQSKAIETPPFGKDRGGRSHFRAEQ
jgi:hypothetical protein